MTVLITHVGAEDYHNYLDDLVALLNDTIESEAAVGFTRASNRSALIRFWKKEVYEWIQNGQRNLLVALAGQRVVGAVQLITDMPSNQPHRAEIAKMMVHRDARRQGIGKRLMNTALQLARDLGKDLVTLDTRSGDAAQALYSALGFEVAGEIPDYALNTDGQTFHATTYMYKRLTTHSD